MARNGSGVFTFAAGTRGVSGSVIESAKYNTGLTEIEEAVTDSINVDGTMAFAANQSMGSNRLTNLADGTSAHNAVNVGQLQANLVGWADAGGTANAITATYSPALTALTDGMICFLRAGAVNTSTTPTFAPNGLTARTITKLGNVALLYGDIAGAGHELILRYKSSGTRWELLNPAIGAIEIVDADAGGSVGPSYGLYRHSASPADGDVLGAIVYYGNDSAGNKTEFARVSGEIVDEANGSEDGALRFRTITAGAASTVALMGAGIWTPNATGGDKGADTINAAAHYVNGVLQHYEVIKAAAETVTSSTTLQADDDLSYPLAANSFTTFDMTIYYDTTAAADFKFDIDSSAATDPTSVGIFYRFLDPSGGTGYNVHSALNTSVSIPAGAGEGFIQVWGRVANGADAGNLRLRWSQATSDASNTRVLRGSSLRWRTV